MLPLDMLSFRRSNGSNRRSVYSSSGWWDQRIRRSPRPLGRTTGPPARASGDRAAARVVVVQFVQMDSLAMIWSGCVPTKLSRRGMRHDSFRLVKQQNQGFHDQWLHGSPATDDALTGGGHGGDHPLRTTEPRRRDPRGLRHSRSKERWLLRSCRRSLPLEAPGR